MRSKSKSQRRLIALNVICLLWGLGPPCEPADAPRQRAKAAKSKGDGKLPVDGWSIGPVKDALLESNYVSVPAKRCIVKTTVSREAGADIGDFADRYLGLLNRVFTGQFVIKGSLKLLVFAHQDELDAYYGKAYSTSEKWPRAALYSPHKKETWVVLIGQGENRTLPVETLRHELTHHILHFFTGRAELPPWFDEGAACFFQYWEVGETKDQNVAQNFGRARRGDFGYFPEVILETFGTKAFLPPAALVAMDYDGFHKKAPQLERLHYSESWALINFLATTPSGQKFLDQVLTGLKKGHKTERILSGEATESLRKAWYADIEQRIIPGLKNAGGGGE